MSAFADGNMREATEEELEDYREAFNNFDKVGGGSNALKRVMQLCCSQHVTVSDKRSSHTEIMLQRALSCIPSGQQLIYLLVRSKWVLSASCCTVLWSLAAGECGAFLPAGWRCRCSQ
eukprot:TRINITY_DN3456_c1_g2_i1.p1 TRINITY_DN3456_c1_g2~~TRINITY_DN3456_c1_g2_i1.p1  ORF type:complete len:118 (+),score=9.05 TRINITY_DN3456_c1_g2_i1:573-926(+)